MPFSILDDSLLVRTIFRSLPWDAVRVAQIKRPGHIHITYDQPLGETVLRLLRAMERHAVDSVSQIEADPIDEEDIIIILAGSKVYGLGIEEEFTPLYRIAGKRNYVHRYLGIRFFVWL